MTVSVPVSLHTLRNGNFNELKKRLVELNAKEVIICLGFCKDLNTAKTILKEVKNYFEIFSSLGYQVAVWARTLDALDKSSYTHLTDFNGTIINSWKCPLDEEFIRDYCKFIEEVAKTGISKILLEDDFRIQNTTFNAACFCDEHLKLYSKLLGKSVTREQMKIKVFNSEPNEYRATWLKANKEVLNDFARKIRSSIDKINPSLQIRLCCGPTLFGGDGSDPYELAKILKNNANQVEFRLIGAPYWKWMFGIDLRSAIDFARFQAHECKKHNITLIGEGDPFPRPRFAVPASDLEFFHTVTIADGNFDGIQKYGLDYTSDFNYETGYANAAKNNLTLYKKIKKAFSGKKCVGFYPVEPLNNIEFAKSVDTSPEYKVMNSPTRKFLNDLSMPVCFTPKGVNVIFGNNACNVNKKILKNGNVIDIDAAIILQQQGIDVGLISADELIPSKPNHGYSANTEFYFEYNDKNLILNKTDKFCALTLNPSAKIQSELQISNCKGIGSYTYENKNGERFLVYNFSANIAVYNEGHIRNYYRQRQIFDLHEWLNGNKLDAVWIGNPDLYILCKKSSKSLTFGIWNRCADPTMNPIINLGECYKNAKFTGFEGILDSNKIIATSPLQPFSFGMVELSK